MTTAIKPLLLVVLDGWGCTEQRESNAIRGAHIPVWDHLWASYPHALINGSGSSVGLPAEQMGNSEVGHLNLGAGRVVYQEYTRVSRAIKTGSFFSNQTLVDAVESAIKNDKALHIFGLLSPGGVHSHEDHIHAMVELAAKRGAKKIYVHAFLDGRDTAPKSAADSLKKMQAKFEELGVGQIASIIGRYYAMDRDHRWPRIQKAYDLITQGVGDFTAEDPLSGLGQAYNRGENDEFVKATAIVPAGTTPIRLVDGDSIIFMNYRSDRARQITRPFIEPDFDAFPRAVFPKLGMFVSLTEYKSDFDVQVAYPPDRLKNVFGEYIAGLGLHQLRIAETEKYAHVTFFFNGGREEPFQFEDRILVNSPNVATYDQQPEMSAFEVTDKLVAAINSGKYDVIICNYANPDMVGHTGNFAATVKAIETIDVCLDKVVKAIQKVGGEMLITADHGNAEMMENPSTHQPHTAHTTNLVPLIYIGRPFKLQIQGGVLSDVAPTMLELMGLPRPSEMTGRSLLEHEPAAVGSS